MFFFQGKHLDIMIPREGVSISCDDMVIPTTAPNKDLAYKFINFFMEPKNAAKNMAFTCFFAPIPESKALAKDIDLDRIFPDVLYTTGQLIMDMGKDNKKFQNIWDEIKMTK